MPSVLVPKTVDHFAFGKATMAAVEEAGRGYGGWGLRWCDGGAEAWLFRAAFLLTCGSSQAPQAPPLAFAQSEPNVKAKVSIEKVLNRRV